MGLKAVSNAQVVTPITIGDPISGGAGGRILYENGSHKLAEAANFTFVNIPGSSAFTNLGSPDGNNAVASVAGDDVGSQDVYTTWVSSNHGGIFALGIDASLGKLILNQSGTFGAAPIFTADGTTFEVIDILKINNTVTAAVAVASTKKVQIDVGGATLYLLATDTP